MQSRGAIGEHGFEGHGGSTRGFFSLHNNDCIVSGSPNGTICKWDCATRYIIGVPWKGEDGGINSLALSPDGRMIACGRNDGSVQRWNTLGEMTEGTWTGHSSCVRSLSWSPSGGDIASGSFDGTILIRKAESGKVEVGPIETKQGKVYSLAYSPAGDKIASGGSNQTICVWDSKTGELLISPITDLRGNVSSLAWSSDSGELYSASDNFARVFDSISGTQLHCFEHDHSLKSIALSPELNILACVGKDGVAQLWNLESHLPLGQSFASPLDRDIDLFCVSFSRDGRYLVYGGGDKKVTLWMIKDITPEVAVSAFMTRLRGDCDKLHNRNLSPHHRLTSTSVFTHTTLPYVLILRSITG
jgi:WD40 repeat protein